jgi:D-glycero-D-manno-heptose 1,7-bisphosphate phosphatase
MVKRPSRSPGVFVDRDGTLIREVGYLTRLEQIEILPRAPAALRLLRQQGLKVAVITNQSAVARGLLSELELEQIHQELKRQLATYGAFLDGIYYCPHHPTEGSGRYRISCDCRKPNAGLARQAAAELNLDITRSYVVGDQLRDMEFAARMGAKGLFIQGEKSESGLEGSDSGGVRVKELWEAAQWIVQDLRPRK